MAVCLCCYLTILQTRWNYRNLLPHHFGVQRVRISIWYRPFLWVTPGSLLVLSSLSLSMEQAYIDRTLWCPFSWIRTFVLNFFHLHCLQKSFFSKNHSWFLREIKPSIHNTLFIKQWTEPTACLWSSTWFHLKHFLLAFCFSLFPDFYSYFF